MIKQKCNYCEKEIDGYSKEHIEYLMNQHLLSKHKDKIKINITERGLKTNDKI